MPVYCPVIPDMEASFHEVSGIHYKRTLIYSFKMNHSKTQTSFGVKFSFAVAMLK